MPPIGKSSNPLENFTPEMIANYSRLMKNAWLDLPVRKIWSPHIAGAEIAGGTLLGSGPPTVVELNSSDLTAVRFATTNSMTLLWDVPADVDLSKDIAIIGKHSNKVATAGTVLYTMLYKAIIVGGAVALAAPTTAFDTDAAAQNAHATAFAPIYTGDNIIKGGTLTTVVPGRDSLAIKITATIGTLADDDLWGLYFRAYSKFMNGASL